MIGKSFIKSTFIFTVAGALPMLASIILLPFYTNRLLPVHYTQVVFYITISLLFQIIFSFSIESYFGVKYSQLFETPDKQKKFIGTISLLMLFIGVVVLILSALTGNYLFNLVYNNDLGMEFWPYGFYSILTAFFNAYFRVASITLIYLKKPVQFMIGNIANFIFTVAATVGGMILFPETIIGPIYGRLISGMVIFIFGLIIFRNNSILVFDRSFLRELVIFCSPYFVYVLSMWVLGQLDRYILQTNISYNDLNTYDLLLKCFFGIEFLQNSLSSVIFPRLYEIWNKDKLNSTSTESNKFFNVFTIINVFQLIVFCMFIPILYRLLIKSELFYESEKYIGLIAGGYALRSILNFYLATILFTKRMDVLLKIFGSSALIQIVSTVILVRYYGLMGAVFASLFTRILQVGFCTFFTRGIYKYEFNGFKIMGIPILFFGYNIVQYLLFGDYNILLYFVQLIVFSVIIYITFRKEIFGTIRQLTGIGRKPINN